MSLPSLDKKKPDPNCPICKGKGYIEWRSMRGTPPNQEPVAAGRDKCKCVKTDKELAAEAMYERDHERIC